MLRISENSPTRLVLEDNRFTLRTPVFIVVSLLSCVMLTGQGIHLLVTRHPTIEQMGVFSLFVLIEIGFIVLGIFTLTVLSQGIRVVFDKSAETVTLTTLRLVRSRQTVLSIYSVSHLHIEKNADLHVYGLFLVLRSSERIPLASIPEYEQAYLETLVHEVRDFLR